jgi:hypothetical protein
MEKSQRKKKMDIYRAGTLRYIEGVGHRRGMIELSTKSTETYILEIEESIEIFTILTKIPEWIDVKGTCKFIVFEG